MPRPEHLFVSSADGSLYDTRNVGWTSLPPLRQNYCRTHSAIKSPADLKATLRNGPFAWPGGYPMFFLTSDGAALSFATVRKELRGILDSVASKRGDGWRVVACDINYEDSDLLDAHTGEKIESAYSD